MMMPIRTVALILFATVSAALAQDPSSTNNADSCDIAVTPAATLLLPYFEVDTSAAVGAGANTLFTITNTSRYPQIAHVTVTGILGASWAVGFAAAPVAASLIASATSQAVAFTTSAALTLPLLWVIARDGRGATAL